MKVLYFGSLRDMVGVSEEDIDLPEGLSDLHSLIVWMRSRNDDFAAAFESLVFLRAAIDQEHAPFEASIIGAREIAFFPPVTGG
ncbi:MAG: molybdopterin converting factor subunit 1 [Rhizobiales bacterium]|nr:molybdopterin converting factor subunit 1 [Hyphomicrobiales bacterium]